LKRFFIDTLTLAVVLAIAIAVILVSLNSLLQLPIFEGLGVNQAIVPPLTDSPDSMNPVQQAQVLVAQAQKEYERTLASINTYLTLIQYGAIILGFVVAAFTLAGRNNLYKLDEGIAQIETRQRDIDDKQRAVTNNLRRISAILNKLKAERKAIQLQNEQFSRALSLTQLAARQIDLGNQRSALDLFEQAHVLDPKNLVLQYFIGDSRLRLGDIEGGMKSLEEAVKGDSNFLAAQAALAYAIRLKGDRETITSERDVWYERAEKLFLDVSRNDSNLLDISGESAFGALAGLYFRRGDTKSAIEWYERAAKVTPQNSYPINNLGILNYHFPQDDKRRDKAKDYFRKSRKKAQYGLGDEANDYWKLFDLITAEAVLEEVPLTKIEAHIDRAIELQPPRVDIMKLCRGLHELNKAPQPSPMIGQVIERLDNRGYRYDSVLL
jgi:tetratricopeptide (TPR) repeat protein